MPNTAINRKLTINIPSSTYEYGDDYSISETTHHENDLTVTIGGRYPDITTDFAVHTGDILYLVYVKYDTGSSFGREEGRIEYVHIFKDQELAYELERLIIHEVNETLDFEKEPTTYKTDSGVALPVYTINWCGYFEEFHGCVVAEVIVS